MKRMSSLALVPSFALILTLSACSGGGGDSGSSSGAVTAGAENGVISGHLTLTSTVGAAESLSVTITPDSTTTVASNKSDDYYTSEASANQTVPTQQIAPAMTVPVDASGNFSAEAPPGTSYSVAVQLSSLVSQAPGSVSTAAAAAAVSGAIIGEITVEPGEKLVLTLDESQLQQPGTVTLQVVDALTSTAVTGTTATLIRTGQSAPVASDGTLTFTGVLPGNHTLLLETAGYADVTRDFALAAGQALDLGTLTLNSQTGTVVGQVSATGFDSLAGIVVYLRGLDGSIYSVFTNASGLYRFERIPAAGGYSVLASANGLRSEKVDNIDVTTGATRAITTLHLQSIEADTGAITGFARFAERADFANAGIIVSIEGTDMEAITARDGSYILNNVPAGTYTLNYTDSNHQTVTREGVKVVATAATKLDPVALASVSGGLSGEVRAQGGAALPGAVLTITGWGEATITDAQGKFTFPALPVGKHTLEASLPGYTASQVIVSVVANTTTPLAAPLELVPHRFSGRVLLGTGDTGHGGVSVTLSGASSYVTTTASNGGFTLSAVPPGNYQLILAMAGYKTQNLAIYVPEDVADYALPYDIRMTLNYGTLSGVARLQNADDHSGTMVTVANTAYTTQTDFNGNWTMSLPEGTYAGGVQYAHAGFISQNKTTAITIVGEQSTALATVTLNREVGSITGVVKNSSGATLGGVAISEPFSGKSTTTAANGSFTLSNIPVGTRTVTASLAGHVAGSAQVTVTSGATSDITGSPIILAPYQFTGTVSLGADVTDHSQVQLVLEGPVNKTTYSATNGSFSFTGAPAGNYHLTLSKSGYITKAVDLQVPDVAVYTLPYRLDLAKSYGTLSGAVRLQNADDHSGTTVTVVGTAYTTQTDISGNWSMSLPEGSYAGGVQYAHAGFISQSTSASITITNKTGTSLSTVTLNQQVGSIAGLVQNSSGAALAGAAVSEPLSGAIAITAADGSFTLANIPVGTRTVTASFAGHVAGSAQVTVTSGAASSLATPIALTPYQFGGTLSLGAGVTDHSGVQLVLEGPASKTTFSAANGSFSFSGAPAGNYRLTLSKSGYVTKSLDVILSEAAVYALPYTLDMTMSYGTLSGVARLQNGVDHSGTTVSVGGTAYTTQTDFNGSWSMSLPVGSYTGGVQYAHAGFISQSNAAAITIASDTNTPLTTVTLDREVGSITGLVQNSSGAVLAGAAISEPFSGASTTTGADGSFTLANIAIGTRTVTASLAGHVAGSAQVTVTSGATSNISSTPITLTPYEFNGTVSLGTGATDHSGVQLVLEGAASKTTFSETNGSFSFSGAPAGNYRLTLSKSGYVSQAINLALSDVASYTLPYDVTLTKAEAQMSGVVQLSGRSDHSGVIVTVAASSTVTNALGQWVVSLPTGVTYSTVTYTAADYQQQTTNNGGLGYTLSEGDNLDLGTVVLQADIGTISGHINAGGTAVASAQVTMVSPTHTFTATTDASGNYSRSDAVTGTYSVSAYKAGYGTAQQGGFVVTQGATTTANFTLIANQIAGSIVLEGLGSGAYGGIPVVLRDGTGTQQGSTTTAADGTFTLTQVVAGTYTLVVNDGGNTSYEVSSIPLTLVGNDGYLFSSAIQVEKKPIVGDRDLLTFDYIKGANSAATDVRYNLVLPLSMPNGSAVAWVSDNPAIITAQGVVTIPYSTVADNVVRLEATLSSGAATDVKVFDLTVPARYQPKYTATVQAITLDEDFGYVFKGMAASNENGEAISYTITDNTNAPLFASVSIDPQSGEVTLRSKENQYGTATLTIQASSGSPALTATASLTVTVNPVADPLAVVAGPDQLLVPGSVVSLDGSASDVDGDATYLWEVISLPSGSTTALVNADQVNATITPDIAGDYILRLTVSNAVYSQNDTLTLRAYPELTVPDQSVTEGNKVTFTLTLSHDHGYPVTLNYATADLTAEMYKDYQPVSGSVIFMPGELSKMITVLVTVDQLPESAEQFVLVLSEMTGLTETSTSATATIEYAPLDLFYLTGENGVEIDNTGSSSIYYAAGTNRIIGDVNGDGFDDMAIGAPYTNNYGGQVTVTLGGASVGKMGRFDASADTGKVTITPASTYGYLGMAVSGAGDFNGDGIEDLVVTAPYEYVYVPGDPTGVFYYQGATYVIYGNDGWSQAVGGSVDLAGFTTGAQGLRILGDNYQGKAIAGVGDVNGDGFDDILLGDSGFDSYRGRAYVIYGSNSYTSDLSLAALGGHGMVIEGAAQNEGAGESVIAAGDMNGDGYADFMIAAPSASTDATAQNYAGGAYLIFGSPALPPTITLPKLTDAVFAHGVVYSGSANNSFGMSADAAGDVNGDGYSDVVIGTPYAYSDWSYYGEAIVLYGSKSLTANTFVATGDLAPEQALRIQGWSAIDRVSGAGDVNGDGLDDVLIGGYYQNGNAGAAYVVYGGATGPINLATLDGSNGFSMAGVEPGVQFGASVDGGGDVNGDGYYDLLVGNGIGMNSYLVYGGNHNARVTADLASGQSYEGSFGSDRIVADRGNEFVTGNGGSDSISTGNGSDSITVSDLSFMRVDGGHGGLIVTETTSTKLDHLYIQTGGSTLDFTVMGPERIRNIEEIHFDGTGPNTVKLDAAAVRRLNNQAGYQLNGASDGKVTVYLHGGADDKVELLDASEWSFEACDPVIANCTVYTHSSGVQFTASPDLPTFPTIDVDDATVNEDRGSVKVRLRRENGVYESTVDYVLMDGTAVVGTDYMALPMGVDTVEFAVGELVKEVTITLLGDVKFETAKSFSLVLQASPTNAVIGKGTATITILDDTIDLSALKPPKGVTFTGGSISATYARGITSAGDVNGDGYEDIIMAAGNADTVVIFGGLDINGGERDLRLITDYSYNLDGSNGFHIAGLYYGWSSVTGIGDINGDGYDDLAVGYPYYGLNAEGVTQVVFGGPSIGAGGVHDISSADPARAIKISGISAYGYAGNVIAGAGDVNRDGYDDLLIGAANANSYRGEAYLVYGHGGSWSDLPLSALDGTNGVKVAGSVDYGYFGATLTAAGDMNGDGYDDFAVGAPDQQACGMYSCDYGKVYLVLGGATTLGSGGVLNLDDSRVIPFSGWQYAYAGRSVANIGDFNRDGFDDLLIGAPYANAAAVNYVGEGYVVYGSASLSGLYLAEEDDPTDANVKLNGSNGFVIRGGIDDLQKGMQLGVRAAHLGDMNGDGYDDVLLGAPYYNSANGGTDDARGKAFVIYGNNYTSPVMEITSLDISSGFAISAENIGDAFADALGGGGDFNGDGFADLLLGAPYSSQQGTSSGRGYLVYGGDFLDRTYYVGTASNDQNTDFLGTHYYPKQGNDYMFVYEGPDYAFLGQGDDGLGLTFWGTYSNSMIGKIDGGKGADSLMIAYGNLDLTTIANNRIKGIETINLHEVEYSGSSTYFLNNVLTLGTGDIMAMLDSDKHTFSVNGDVQDSVTVTDGNWTYNGIVSADGLVWGYAGMYVTRNYNEWSLNGTPIKLRIDQDITSVSGLPLP